MKTYQHLLATAIIAGGLTFAFTGQAQQQPGGGKSGKGQARPGQGQRPGPGQARPGQRPQRPGGGFRRRNPYEGIGLSAEQQGKITAIQREQSAEMRELFQELRDGGGDRQTFSAKLSALREKYQKQTDAVLTAEQRKKMAEARAQRDQGRQPGGRGGTFGRDPFSTLGLKEGQKKKLAAARQEMSNQLRALFTARDTPREERAAKMQKIREAYEATIKNVLTAAQMKKYQESRNGRGGRGQGQGQGRQPGQGGFGSRRNPYADLGLTKEQQAKMEKVAAAQLEEQTKLLQESRNGGGNREELRGKFNALREKYQKQIDSILTDEQKKKLQEQRQLRPQQRPGRRPQPPREDI